MAVYERQERLGKGGPRKDDAPPLVPSPPAFGFVLIIGIAILGFLLILSAYWPGIMIDDARWQYQQALDNSFEDWHPPLMAWIWHHLIPVARGPAPMFVLQLLLYWVGIALIATSAYRRGKPGQASAFLCAGFLPAPLALTGSVTKDALMNGALLLATGLLLWRPLVSRTSSRTFFGCAAFLFLCFAAALRFNAFFATIPLALAAIPRVMTRTKLRLLGSAMACGLLFLAIPPAIVALLHAENTDVQLSLIIFDLGGITEHAKVNQFPVDTRNAVAVNHQCYDPRNWDSYSDWAPKRCPLGFDAIQPLVDDEDIDAHQLWMRAIVNHPVAYAEHRLTHFNVSTWFLVGSGPKATAWSQSVPNPWGFQVKGNGRLAIINGVTNLVAQTPLGWPIFWISVALAAFVAALMLSLPAEMIAISASALLYGGAYLLVGVATGIRYHMWTFSGGAIAASLVGAELWRRRSLLSRSAYIVPIACVAVPSSLAIGSRILLS